MGRRGRRPHPDILTPREWEVLDLLRKRLTNEQIAERLGITLDGSKYHVSQILSKLGVTAREEAAAWQPAAASPRWQHLIGLPTAAKVAGALTLIAAAAGLAVLAWAVVETGGPEGNEALMSEELPPPRSSPILSRDVALMLGVRVGSPLPNDLRTLTLQPTRYDAALDALLARGISDPYVSTQPEGDTVWLLFVTGIVPGEPPNCREAYAIIDDADGDIIAAGGGRPVDPCPAKPSVAPGANLSQDQALVGAGLYAGQVGIRPGDDVSASVTTLRSAIETMAARGFSSLEYRNVGTPQGDPVWLVFFTGTGPPLIAEGQTPPCGDFVIVLDDTAGQPVIQAFSRLGSPC
jgi:DNA-binding CsgD family transcriptional regulator